MSIRRQCFRGLLFIVCAVLSACADRGPGPKPPAPGVKLGKPYSVFGSTYVPKYEPYYDETGIASWYGPGFHGKRTASGEEFDQDALTAAHTTLPMPSLARVTNLSNGKTVVVRINDRGPFKSRRIIDLSRASARRLGITGTAEVRVQFLKEESEQYWASMNMKQPKDVMLAQAKETAPEDGAEEFTQIKSSAPLMTVSQNDLPSPSRRQDPAPERSKSPRFSFIGNAEAASTPPSAIVQALPYGQEEENPPASAQHASPAHGWFAQAGVFASAENVRKLTARISSVGAVKVTNMEHNGASLQRVLVGPFSSSDKAEKARIKLVSLGVPDARVVHE